MFNRFFTRLFFLALGTFALFFATLGISRAEFVLQGELQHSLRRAAAVENVRVSLRIYDDEFAGRLIYEEAQKFAAATEALSFTFGRGNITVSDRSAAPEPEKLWVEVEIDDQILTPRINLVTINETRDLDGNNLRLAAAGLRTAGPATLVISDFGIAMNGLLDMGSQSIKLGSVERNDWPAGNNCLQAVVSDATLNGNGTSAQPLSVNGDLTDDQTLSISGNDLSISSGNTVALPTAANTSGWTDDGSVVKLSTSTDNVVIGTSTPNSLYKLQVKVTTDIAGKTAIFGHASTGPPPTHSGYGVYGLFESDSTGGAGVFGEARVGGNGVVGTTDAIDGYGVFGEHTNGGFAGWFSGKGYFSDNVGIGTAIPQATLHVKGNDGVLFEGTFGSGTIPKEGAGTRMMWYPKKAAFRAGEVDGTQWDDSNIGDFSAAMGSGTTASGDYSTAMGQYTTASGYSSTAMGAGATASGAFSTAMGYITEASGAFSTAMGYITEASGNYSTAMGNYTKAQSTFSVALGQYNVGGGSPDSWVDTDPLFEIGNGTSNHKSNAVTVLKNGNTHISGTITSGTANVSLPIAYGVINTAGSVNNATNNVSCVWVSDHYEISISGESYSQTAYVCSIEALGISPVTTTTGASGGKLLVYIYNSLGTQIKDAFHFVIYKL